MVSVKKDLTGKRFGYLTVLNQADDHIKSSGKHEPRWRCICDCGNIVYWTSTNLSHKIEHSCGCKKNAKNKKALTEDLTGKTFGMLTVIKQEESQKTKSGYSKTAWLCKCKCGNFVVVRSRSLKTGNTQSCGCYKKEHSANVRFVDLTGAKIGKLYVEKEAFRKNKQRIWKCVCECGTIKFLSTNKLRSRHTKSCGCLLSLGEEETRRVLLEKTIEFTTQYTFDDLRSKKGNCLMFDFALQNKNKEMLCLIEYQGEQHYRDCGRFGKMQREETDQLKRDYCKEHNIPLYEIRYDENIEDRIDEILADIHYFDEQPP